MAFAPTSTADEDVLALARARALAQSGRARSIRLTARLSLADIAGAIGSNASSVQRWEAGVRKPYGGAALRWLALLDALERQNDHDPEANRAVEKEGAGAARSAA